MSGWLTKLDRCDMHTQRKFACGSEVQVRKTPQLDHRRLPLFKVEMGVAEMQRWSHCPSHTHMTSSTLTLILCPLEPDAILLTVNIRTPS